MQDLLKAVNEVLETILMVEPGTTNFYILLGVGVGAMLIFGKPIADHVFGGRSGWVVSFLGMALPAAILILGLAAVDLYLLGYIDSKTWQMVAKIVSGLVALLLGCALSGKFLLRISVVRSFAAVVLICAASYACVYIGYYALESFAAGAKQAESRRDRLEH